MWQVHFGLVDGTQLRKTFRTKHEAESWARKTKRAVWPLIRKRGGSWQVDLGLYRGRRTMRSFRTFQEAEVWAEQKRVERRNRGLAVFDLTEKQRLDALDALRILEGKCSGNEAENTEALQAPPGHSGAMSVPRQGFGSCPFIRKSSANSPARSSFGFAAA